MTLAFQAREAHPVVDLLLRDLDRAGPPVDRSIDEEDEMLHFARAMHEGDEDAALAAYFRDGLSVYSAIRQFAAWHAGGLGKLGAMLDFASGYGRVTRFLARELPPERLWVSDIYRGAVDFQASTFGVHGLVSVPEPDELRCAQRFDLIFVTSLFTHLPEPTFRGWLARLLSLLAPRGLLVFSVHDESLLLPGQEMAAGGLRFEASSESRSLDPQAYGSTWVSESFVRAAVGAHAPGAVCARIPRALGHFQDLYAVSLDAAANPARLEFDPGPGGFLERCSIAAGTVTFEGWAAELSASGSVAAVRAWLGGEPAGELRAFGVRDDVAARVGLGGREYGWRFAAPLPRRLRHGMLPLVVEAETTRGIRGALFAGTLAQALRLAVQGELQVSESRRRQEAETSALSIRRLELDVEALRARIAAMEASRFWKMRNAWFSAKRAVGLTRDS